MRIATLTERQLYIRNLSDGVQTTLDYPYTVTSYDEILGLVETHRLDYLWVLSGCATTGDNPQFKGYNVIPSRRKDFGERKGEVQAWRMWKLGAKGNESRTIKVILCKVARQWGFHKETDGLAVLHSLVALIKKGITFELSPGGTGRALIKAKTRTEWLEPADLSMLPKSLAVPSSLKRELTEAEKSKKYLHIYDKSAQFLRGCTGVELGVGTPMGVADRVGGFFSERMPGLWLVSVDGRDPQWLWTPRIHYLRRTGHDVAFSAAYVWRRHHTILRAWAEYLWSVRVAVADDKRAKATNKRFYTQGLGWLRMGEEWGRDSHDDLFRPDWHELVKQYAFSLIDFKMDQLRKAGYSVVWCLADEIGILSDDPNPLTAVPGLASVSAEMGGFTSKYGGAIPLDKVAHIFDSSVDRDEAAKILLGAGKEVDRWQ